MELAALARGRRHPDRSAMALDDLLADREADAGAGVFPHRVQPLEDHEDALEVLRLDADAVVGDGDLPRIALVLGADVDARYAGAAELERVADQVLEQLRELHVVHALGGQRIPGDGGPGLLER